MTQELPFLPLYCDRYLADTRHLTTEQHGAYFLLLLEAWRRADNALPDDDGMLARLAGLSPQKWRAMKQPVMNYWNLIDGSWRNKQLDKRREEAEARRAQASEAGKASALKRNKSGSTTVQRKRQRNKQRETQPDINRTATDEATIEITDNNPLTPKGENDLDDFEEEEAEQIWQACERFMDQRWPKDNDPVPKTPGNYDSLHASCEDLARDGITVAVFERIMAREFASVMPRPPLSGLRGYRDRLLRESAAWLTLKRGGSWIGKEGAPPPPEVIAAWRVPRAMYDERLDGEREDWKRPKPDDTVSLGSPGLEPIPEFLDRRNQK